MRLQTDSDQDTVLMAAVAAVPDLEVILTLLKCGANPGELVQSQIQYAYCCARPAKEELKNSRRKNCTRHVRVVLIS